jgi:hypothetical protein
MSDHPRVRFTDEECVRGLELAHEAEALSQKARDLFSDDTKGMLLFLLHLKMLQEAHAGLFAKTDKAVELVMEWVAAGEPEDPAQVPMRLRPRMEEEYVRRRTEGNNVLG